MYPVPRISSNTFVNKRLQTRQKRKDNPPNLITQHAATKSPLRKRVKGVVKNSWEKKELTRHYRL
ncbi:MAG: hypothetical protein CV087_12245 [Candidatus Brocadia sp. WS118]|nr:MAG: hypothetical protein CV087_12245 [Candidatus Brocadia sp. WS118]